MPRIERQGITLVGISVANLDDERAVQLTLPFDDDDARALDTAIDGVRNRFGTNAITRGVHLGRDQGIAMPLLPD
jgi:DNA polymerase-4